MSNYVFVLDTDRNPLTPCHPGVARGLLDAGKAAVFRRYPFTIILNKSVETESEPCQGKIDPGSRITGFAILLGNRVIWAAELTHRGLAIRDALASRRALRRGRRNRKTRYRQPRFLNRRRPEGWLAPSLRHRVETILTWVKRIQRVCLVGSVVMERVRFDLQRMQNPDISGVEYQQGELAGYEVREYLLEKWARKCAYCGAQHVPLQIEHIKPRSKGGSNRVSNLTLACEPCNLTKGNQDIRDFLSRKPDVLTRVLKQAKTPLNHAAAVNSTRNALYQELCNLDLPVMMGSGGQTKFNRCRLGLPKTHWLDAACVGDVVFLQVETAKPLLIRPMGHGHRQMCGTDKYGFPKRHRSTAQIHKGFQTGDIVRAVVHKTTKLKTAGTYIGRVAVRASGSFNVLTSVGKMQGISFKDCVAVHQKDGYAYSF